MAPTSAAVSRWFATGGCTVLALLLCWRESGIGWGRWTTGDALQWRELGARALAANDTARAMESLVHAVSLNPYDAESLAALGLIAESQGRWIDAERYLLNAVQVSNRSKPKLALASFYYRQHRMKEFWGAAAGAANVPATDPSVAFELATSVESNPGRVRELLRLESSPVLARYLTFLLRQHKDSGVAAVALQLKPASAFARLLLESCDRLLETGQTANAIAVWNRLYPAARLDPAQDASLTDGLFQQREAGGFHWRVAKPYGVEIGPAQPSGLRMEFSGHQPERLTLMEQFVPVLPGRNYQLVYRFETSEIHAVTGVRWVLAAPRATEGIASPPIPAADNSSANFPFLTGPNTDLLRLALICQRESGRMRVEGVIRLLTADLKLLE